MRLDFHQYLLGSLSVLSPYLLDQSGIGCQLMQSKHDFNMKGIPSPLVAFCSFILFARSAPQLVGIRWNGWKLFSLRHCRFTMRLTIDPGGEIGDVHL